MASGGVSGLLPRDAATDAVSSALLAAANGLLLLDPVYINTVSQTPSPSGEPLIEALTPREIEVLQLVAEGLANKAIARELDISDHTVKFHLNAIMGKLGVNSRTEAVVRATRAGLILL